MQQVRVQRLPRAGARTRPQPVPTRPRRVTRPAQTWSWPRSRRSSPRPAHRTVEPHLTIFVKRPWDVTDGPLIVQSDKTLLLEVDHDRAGECRRADRAVRRARALARARAHLPADAAGAVERPRRRATTPSRSSTSSLEYSRYAVPHALLVDVAETMARYGRLRLEKHPVHGLVLATTDRAVLEEVVRSKKVQPLVGERVDPDTVVGAPVRARPPQAGAAQARLAGRGPRRLRRRRGARDRAWSRTAGRCATTSARRSKASGTAGPASSCCPAVPARPSSAQRRWRGRRRRRSSW